jgi:hypothetical protein
VVADEVDLIPRIMEGDVVVGDDQTLRQPALQLRVKRA